MSGRRRLRGLALLPLLALAACGSSGSGVRAPIIAKARTFSLAGFTPARTSGLKATVSFHVEKPSGGAMTAADYNHGVGPHTGIHLILVRDDLRAIVHRHPVVAPDGSVSLPIAFPGAGGYHVLVDIYSGLRNTLPNFQLTRNITIEHALGAPKPLLPPFRRVVNAGHGYTMTLSARPHLRAIQPATISAKITRPDGSPAKFTPWYGALAHAIFFRAGTLDYFHTHVCGVAAPNCTSRIGGAKVVGTPTAPGRIRVGVLLPLKGTWRLFLQCKVDGRILTAPYTLRVS